MSLKDFALNKQDTLSNTGLLLVIPALFIAGFGCFSVYHIEEFLSLLKSNPSFSEQQKATFQFSFPFIIVSMLSLAALVIVGMRYRQKSRKLKQLVAECLTNLEFKSSEDVEISQENEEVIDVQKIIEDTKIQMNQLAHVVSHDLRSSLRTINSFTGILQKNLQDRLTERESTQMNFIRTDTLKLSNKLEQLSEFARLEQYLIQPWHHNLLDVLKKSILQCKSEIDKTDTSINFPESLPTIFCDERKINEIFTQIIRNAIRYSNPGSQPKLDITYSENDSFVEFQFKDYGIGIPIESIEKIFLSFIQLKEIKKQEGVGIGLAICRKYVELHDGKIWCEPSEGQTNIIFRLSKHLEKHQDLNVNLATTSM